MRLRWKVAQAAEIRWWRRYWNKKDTTEYLEWKRKYWENFLSRCQLSPPANAHCLDIGCGPAGIFIALSNQKVHAIDPLLDAYRRDLQHFDPSQYPYVRFECLPVEHRPTDQQYAYVFCLNVINHVADWAAALANIWAAVQTGGKLILSVDVNRFGWAGWLFRHTWLDVLHPHQHRRSDYEQAFRQLDGAVITQTIALEKGFWFDYYVWVIERRV